MVNRLVRQQCKKLPSTRVSTPLGALLILRVGSDNCLDAGMTYRWTLARPINTRHSLVRCLPRTPQSVRFHLTHYLTSLSAYQNIGSHQFWLSCHIGELFPASCWVQSSDRVFRDHEPGMYLAVAQVENRHTLYTYKMRFGLENDSSKLCRPEVEIIFVTVHFITAYTCNSVYIFFFFFAFSH